MLFRPSNRIRLLAVALFALLALPLTEYLSVNSSSLPPADHGASEGEKRNVACLCLFEADQQFAEPIDP